MAQYFIVHSTTREVANVSSTPFNIDESVQPPAPYLQLKRVDNDTIPAFNIATQKLVRIFTDNDTLFTRTFSWSVVAKTQAEIDAYNLEQDDNNTLTVIRNNYQALINGTGTATDRLVRCERGLAYLLRLLVRNQ
jgi:hypothetical protein